MSNGFQYRLSKNQKGEIAQNLIDILQKDANITGLTRTFIYNWIRTSSKEKRKAFFDVWDIVLKNYLPTERPILFRSCSRISKKDKIASFTGRLECARKIGKGRGNLIICDTNENLEFEETLFKPGEYKNSFYPLVNVLKKAKNSGGCGFPEGIFDYIGEDEYIMRIIPTKINRFRWIRNDL
nr:hypothetical protein [uncultured Fluviicola sp.]